MKTTRIMATMMSAMLITSILGTSNMFPNESVCITASASQQNDIVSVALAEEGYVEGANNDNKYGAALGNNYAAWCAYFISWCARQCGIPESIIKNNGWAGSMAGTAKTGNFGGNYYPKSYVFDGQFTPKKGDLVYYDAAQVNGESGHVELVIAYYPDTQTVDSIGGNTTMENTSRDGVRRHNGRSLHTTGTATTIVGFERPNYSGISVEDEIAAKAEKLKEAVSEVFHHDEQTNSKGGAAAITVLNDEPIAPYPRPTGYVKKGDKSPYVGWIQYCLFKQLGYGDESDVVDCAFGSATELAVKTFQENYGLEVDGVAGSETVACLVARVQEALNPPDPTPHGSEMASGSGQTLPDGDYYIFSVLDPYLYLDIDGSDYPAEPGTNVYVWNSSKDKLPPECDAWTLTYVGNGFYSITQKGTNIGLDVANADTARGAAVRVWTHNTSSAQLWSISATETGYKIQAKCSGYCLDVANGEKANGTDVRTWDDNGSEAQRFVFTPYTVTQTTKATTLTTTTTTTTTTTATTVETTVPVLLRPGDVNCDKAVDVGDAVMLARFIAEDTDVQITTEGLRAADVNSDGNITQEDTIYILQIIAKIL